MAENNKKPASDYNPQNPRCDETQLKFLKDCIARGEKGIAEWNKWRRENPREDIWLQQADFEEAHL
ncbi:MAG: hypothetical protein NTX52_05650, partial [Planctomycetota bacterium]|nr:hypothetical protein [Planctomycetota bacterium]